MFRVRLSSIFIATLVAAQILPTWRAIAEDKLLAEAVNFTGTLTYLNAKVPGFILIAVRKGEMAFAGFGNVTDNSSKPPDADTMFRIGSISKVFCGQVLASMVLASELRFADRLQDRLGYDVKLPEKAGQSIRIIDLVTQASGLPREVPRIEGPPNDPFATNNKDAEIADLKKDPLLFAPGTAVLYSNYGFDLLGAALANTGRKSYEELFKERVLDPVGMKDTVFNPRPGDDGRLMQGHNFDGSAMPTAPTPTSIECAGGLYTTANDMARWMKWQLDQQATTDRDLRLLDHAAYLYRDGLANVSGVDDAGQMDAMGLAWVINMPTQNRPLILQKTGGLQGYFSYLAIAPTRDVGVFFVMNQFNLGSLSTAVAAANSLIAQLAPR